MPADPRGGFLDPRDHLLCYGRDWEVADQELGVLAPSYLHQIGTSAWSTVTEAKGVRVLLCPLAGSFELLT